MPRNLHVLPHFWRSVLSVMSGTALAQLIPILGSLIIAREYAPSQFGEFSAWLGVVTIAAVMATGRFETSFAIVADDEPRRIAVVCTIVTLFLAVIVLAALSAIASLLGPSWLTAKGSLLFALFIPAVLFGATAQIWQMWAATAGRYRQLSTIRIGQAVSVVFAQIAAGALFPSAGALASAYTIGSFVSLGICFYLLPLGRWPADIVKLVWLFWKRYVRFPLYSLPADAINTLAGQLPILVVANRFGPEITGLLALTMRTLGGPISLLGNSVLDVFKRQAATTYRERGECRSEYVQTFLFLASLSIVMSIALLFTSRALFAVAFGERWRFAGTVAIWLLPMFALRFVASPLSYMVYVVEKQHMDLIWQMCLLVMTVLSLNLPLGYPAVLQSYSLGYALMYVVYLAMSYRFSVGDKR